MQLLVGLGVKHVTYVVVDLSQHYIVVPTGVGYDRLLDINIVKKLELDLVSRVPNLGVRLDSLPYVRA